MKKHLLDDISLESLIQYLEGMADSMVKQSVERWIANDQQHGIFFNRIKEAWSNPDDLKVLDKSNVDKDLDQVLQRIKKVRTEGTSKGVYFESGRWYQKSWLRIAAIITIVIALAGGTLITQRPHVVQSDKITYNEIIIPFGLKSKIVLSDGSKIWINAGSKLRFPNRFGSKIREVWLDGEAFFEVAKDASKPFYVRTSDLNIKVLGTSFNVKAYSDEGIIETTLVSGRVSLEKANASNSGEKEVILEPNRKAIYIKNELSLMTEENKRYIAGPLKPRKIIISEPVKLEPLVSWTEDRLVFENEPFENIAKQLERRYGMQIIIEDNELKQYRYTGVLKKISIEQAIKAIQLTAKFNYAILDNKLTIVTADASH